MTHGQGSNSSKSKKPLAGSGSNKENVCKKPPSQAVAGSKAQLNKPFVSASKTGAGIGSVNKLAKRRKPSGFSRATYFPNPEVEITAQGKLYAHSFISNPPANCIFLGVSPCDEDWAIGLGEASVSTPLKKRSTINGEPRPPTPYPKKVSSKVSGVPQASVVDMKSEFICPNFSLPESMSPSFVTLLALVSNEELPVPVVPYTTVGTKPPFPCPDFSLPETLVSYEELQVPIVPRSNVDTKPPFPCPDFSLPEIPTVSCANRGAMSLVDTGDTTVDIEHELDKFYRKFGDACNLMDISLGSLEKVEIDYSYEFPTSAIGQMPHILVTHC
ncbi:hypothetical protein AMATHDRAFT_51356 [Amanita thiersii Skay4041]|uniref:Uncharacterized protein n=1 Tax=Amanita thiersii Skay4041 TaxID=703135 RepID=A0A2A9NE35_9AGAR|nr:hypothetical protein AMATHDRAFT_51356 [Amanita thiersii Skay4041]